MSLTNPDRIYHGVTGMLVSHGEKKTVEYLTQMIALIDMDIIQKVIQRLEDDAQAEEGSR